jgi:putative addiction module killer protein
MASVYEIRPLPEFTAWLHGIRDGMTKRRLVRRLEKAGQGQLGDVKPVGEGVFEMREFFGPGWRMYYIQQGDMLIVMLGGGDKSTQAADIAKAIALAAPVRD